jgi:hypothetical protein
MSRLGGTTASVGTLCVVDPRGEVLNRLDASGTVRGILARPVLFIKSPFSVHLLTPYLATHTPKPKDCADKCCYAQLFISRRQHDEQGSGDQQNSVHDKY